HRLLRLLTLSQAIGNLDMHGKNISMLHLQDGSTRLTPAYDVVPQTHLDSDGKMALAINRKFLHAAITVDDLIEEAESWKLRSPRTIIMETLDAVEGFVHSEAPVKNAYDRLQVDIAAFTRNLVEGRPTGHGE
uniref:HipA domain-containing protein n=1 Tax=Lacisediminihabitans sp. TaxID=2787631 RepID=UPI00374CC922